MLGAGVVLRGPGGERSPLAPMRELAPGTDRYGAEVTVGGEGLWQFQVEAWGDPIAHWRHDADIKVPRGLETELMLTEGALLFERAARASAVLARGATPRSTPAANRRPGDAPSPRPHRRGPVGQRWPARRWRPGGTHRAGHGCARWPRCCGTRPCRRGTGWPPPRPTGCWPSWPSTRCAT